MKVLLITPSSQQVVGFRKNLIEMLQAEKHDVAVLTFDDQYKDTIQERSIAFYCVPDRNRSVNPLYVLSLKSKYYHIIKQVNPDIVFTFMLKPNTFGVLAAKKAGVKKIFSMVEGAGDVFVHNSFKWNVIRSVVCHLYKSSFRHCQSVFFLNQDDRKEFIARGLVKAEQCHVLHGIGVDLEKYAYRPVKNHNTFLMVARMIKTKGVFEYCQCARTVKQKYPDVIFNYLGPEGTVTVADIRQYIEDGSINYLGTTDDVRPYYENCFVCVLPSYYREGLPASIMEANAVGRPILANNTVGSRDAVVDGQTGFLVDNSHLAEKAVWFLEHPEEAEKMGRNARKFAEENFDQLEINKQILDIISS